MDFIYLNTVKKIVIRLKRKITNQKETDKSTKVRFCAEFEKEEKGNSRSHIRPNRLKHLNKIRKFCYILQSYK